MTSAILYFGYLIDQQAAIAQHWLESRPLGPVIVMLLIGIVCIGFASREQRI
jgi:hypothetical protein